MNILRQLGSVSSITSVRTTRLFSTPAASMSKRVLRAYYFRPSGRMEVERISKSVQEPAREDAEYTDAVNLLNELQAGHALRNRGKKRSASSRQRTEEWLKLLGHDVLKLSKPKVIHVAGTKGKGTTCFYCNHILCEYRSKEGKPNKVGCYTSPHMIEVRERIQINSNPIAKSLFTRYVWMLWKEVQFLFNKTDVETPPIPGYPGFLTLLAIYVFILEGVDVAVIETGVGGENDSTNVFRNPVATGVTTIDLDHIGLLGNNIEGIARHKAGIFKEGCLAFTVPQKQSVLEVLRKRASEVHTLGELEIVTDKTANGYGVIVDPNLHYQRLNASLAICLASAYLKSTNPHFVMTRRLARSVERASLPGRCQVKADEQNTWFLSVAHNSVSLVETISWFKDIVDTPRHKVAPGILIFSHRSRRDSHSLLRTIYKSLTADRPMSLRAVIFCSDQSDQAENEIPDLIDLRRYLEAPDFLQLEKSHAKTWESLGGCAETIVVHTVRQAIQIVRENYCGANVLVTGSHYLIGGVLHIFQHQT